jgi:hypothetical protein
LATHAIQLELPSASRSSWGLTCAKCPLPPVSLSNSPPRNCHCESRQCAVLDIGFVPIAAFATLGVSAVIASIKFNGV